MSNNEYEYQTFWNKVNEKLNEEQESVCIEKTADGRCLVSVSFKTLDFFKTKKDDNKDV
jgi:hypothetical protein